MLRRSRPSSGFTRSEPGLTSPPLVSVIAEENGLKDYENIMLYPPSYFLFQLEQACSTCLILACSRIAADQQVSSTVLDLFVSFIDVFMSNWKPTSIQKSCRLPPGLPWPSLCMGVSPSWVSLGQQWVQMVVWCQVIWVPWVFHFDFYRKTTTSKSLQLN